MSKKILKPNFEYTLCSLLLQRAVEEQEEDKVKVETGMVIRLHQTCPQHWLHGALK